MPSAQLTDVPILSQIATYNRVLTDTVAPCPVCFTSDSTAYLSCGHACCPECLVACVQDGGDCPTCLQPPMESPTLFFLMRNETAPEPPMPAWLSPHAVAEWKTLHTSGDDLSTLFWLRVSASHVHPDDSVIVLVETNDVAVTVSKYLLSKHIDVPVITRVQLETGLVNTDATIVLALLRKLPHTEALIRSTCISARTIRSFVAV